MADVTSAASFVTAALETAGYITQAQFLDAFENFFNSTGALLFLFAALGAMISMVVFGSFKLFRYLFIMPFIYYLLITPREDLSGSIWRLGATGYPRSLTKVYEKENTDPAALAVNVVTYKDSNKNLNAVRKGEGSISDSDNIRVSSVFAQMIKLIDQLVAQFVSLIISHKDDKALMSLNKAKMLEGVLNANPNLPEVTKMLTSDLFDRCSSLTGATVFDSKKLSQTRIDKFKEHIQEDGSNAEGLSDYTNYLDAAKIISEQDLETARFKKYMTPTADTANYVKANLGQSIENGLAGRLDDYIEKYKQYPGVQDLISYAQGNNWKSTAIPCGAMWEILKHAMVKEADWLSNELKEKHVPKGEVAEEDRERLQNELCWSVLEVLQKENYTGNVAAESLVGDCDLVRVSLIYMLRNGIAGSERSHAINIKKNQMNFLGDIPGKKIAALEDSQNWEFVQDSTNVETRKFFDALFVYTSGNVSQDTMGLGVFKHKKTNQTRTSVYTTIGKIGGPLDMAYVEQQRYHTRTLRQSIYAYALQLPYWQGLILYLLAAAYPFVALIVLVPNRAQSMLTYFLTWLWVKSWDIGMAIIMVTDRIIWNIFPKTDIGVRIKDMSFQSMEFETILQEAMRVDPTYNLHSYYMMISMGIFAIPAITGLLILKGKRSALAIFSDQMASSASASGSIRGSGYATDFANTQAGANQAMGALAYAPMTTGEYGRTYLNNLTGWANAGMLGAATVVTNNASDIVKTGGVNAAPISLPQIKSSVTGIAKEAFSNYTKVRDAEITAGIGYNRVWNPDYGRFSDRGIAMESRSNALGDSESGFEMQVIDHAYGATVETSKNLFKAKFDVVNAVVGNAFSSVFNPKFIAGFKPGSGFFGQGGGFAATTGMGYWGEADDQAIGEQYLNFTGNAMDWLMPVTEEQRRAAIENESLNILHFPYGYGAATLDALGYQGQYHELGVTYPDTKKIADRTMPYVIDNLNDEQPAHLQPAPASSNDFHWGNGSGEEK
ncbi:MAG: hypothetical protein IT292_04125 [Deltaproteobacteria bacterium]|nr:hypothetical protein [Deltaproteobacteria bacterium]